MKLTLSWMPSSDGLFPICSSDVSNKEGIDTLACVLSDDGGQGIWNVVPWLDEGIRRITSVTSDGVGMVNWIRDAWGVELTTTQAKIYSLYDESCFQVIALGSFEKALISWRDFIQSTPVSGLAQIIEI
ncbi:hypothetical protein [Herbaspirillum huttiense]|uniref:hypothetical protein n=1 Tax=Herbaspirillum huttiense TaxID=863372 RepID=UPI0031D0D729